jgi:hypothetical protein
MADASGERAANIALGSNSSASGNGTGNIAIGSGATASGNNAFNMAVGFGANASGGGMAVGTAAFAAGAGDIAIGQEARVEADNGSAFGAVASVGAGLTNAAAFGAGATTTRANQQSFGTASNTYTMAGIASNQSKAAQGKPTTIVTSNANGDLAAYTPKELGLASQSEINAINSRITSVGARADKAVTGVAMAFAAAGVPSLVPGERFAVMGNWGSFEGENGLALNAALRLSANMQLNGGVAYGVSEDIAGGRVGLRYGW